jgi:hypothetical protein
MPIRVLRSCTGRGHWHVPLRKGLIPEKFRIAPLLRFPEKLFQHMEKASHDILIGKGAKNFKSIAERSWSRTI